MPPKSAGTPQRRTGTRGSTLATKVSHANARSVIGVSTAERRDRLRERLLDGRLVRDVADVHEHAPTVLAQGALGRAVPLGARAPDGDGRAGAPRASAEQREKLADRRGRERAVGA